jgi:hypothetical protein
MAASPSTPQVRQRLFGCWRLISYHTQSPSGEVSCPLGEDPLGQLGYDASGRMSAHLMRRNPEPFAHRNLFAAQSAEKCRAWSGYMGYWGTFTVDEATHTVNHLVEGGWFPNMVGTIQVRDYRFDGELLMLSATTEDGSARLVWQKI